MKCRCGGAQCSHLHGVVWRLFDEMVLASCSTAAAEGVSEQPWPGCAVVRRAGRHMHMRTVSARRAGPRKGREANQPSVWVDHGWIVIEVEDLWLRFCSSVITSWQRQRAFVLQVETNIQVGNVKCKRTAETHHSSHVLILEYLSPTCMHEFLCLTSEGTLFSLDCLDLVSRDPPSPSGKFVIFFRNIRNNASCRCDFTKSSSKWCRSIYVYLKMTLYLSVF